MLTSQEAAQNLNDWFAEAKRIYKQTDNFYISTKTILGGLHLAVLPSPERYKFSIYTFRNRQAVQHIRTLFTQRNVCKSCCCSLCPINDLYDTRAISTEQNQLSSDSENAPSNIINHNFMSTSGWNFSIVGPLTRFFYYHLMMVSENHIPSYGIFLDFELFSGVMEFLHYSDNDQLVAYHNGNFGSDKYHFHVHLSSQINETLSTIIEDSINSKYPNKLIHNQGIIKCVSYIDSDITALFYNISNDMMEMFRGMIIDPNLGISSTLFVRTRGGKKIYGIVINIINMTQNSWTYNDCTYYLMPTSYILIADCFPTSMDAEEYKLFLHELSNHYTSYYYDPKSFSYLFITYQPTQSTYRPELLQLLKTIIQELGIVPGGVTHVLTTYPLEFIYLALQSLGKSIHVTPEEAETLLDYITGVPCLELGEPCNREQMGKFKYFLGLAINNIADIDILFQDK